MNAFKQAEQAELVGVREVRARKSIKKRNEIYLIEGESQELGGKQQGGAHCKAGL